MKYYEIVWSGSITDLIVNSVYCTDDDNNIQTSVDIYRSGKMCKYNIYYYGLCNSHRDLIAFKNNHSESIKSFKEITKEEFFVYNL